MCSADGKIRLATLELSCLLLKQQVVTSTGCIIKDVHLACLEVRASPHPVPRAAVTGRVTEGSWRPRDHRGEAGPVSPDACCDLPVPTELPFCWGWLDKPT